MKNNNIGSEDFKTTNGKGVTFEHPDGGLLKISDEPKKIQEIYSWCKENWRQDWVLLNGKLLGDYPYPMVTIDFDVGKFEIGCDGTNYNEWTVTEESIQNILYGGFIKYNIDADSSGSVVYHDGYMCIEFLGDKDKADGVYLEADGIEYKPYHFDLNRHLSITQIIIPIPKSDCIVKNIYNDESHIVEKRGYNRNFDRYTNRLYAVPFVYKNKEE
jgi:hypothetical protein